MALWITKQRALPGPVFGAADNFEGLGLFFDTYKNNRPGVVFPYVSAMLGMWPLYPASCALGG
jgi:mannose-binding lectin 2